MADPETHGSIEYVKGCLRRIGLNLVQAADMKKLNDAMTEHKLDTAQRIEIKRLLAALGVID